MTTSSVRVRPVRPGPRCTCRDRACVDRAIPHVCARQPPCAHQELIHDLATRKDERLPEQVAPLFPAQRVMSAEPERSEEHTSELQSRGKLVCRPLLEK